MPTVVTDCPRCGANQMTFDAIADVYVGQSYGWQSHHEVTVNCRRCRRPSILKVKLRDIDHKMDFVTNGSISAIDGDLEPVFQVEEFLNVGDLHGVAEPPDHVPAEIGAAFQEAAKCMAIGCHNAAASMFRLCLDLTTKPLLPDAGDATVAQPTKEQRYKLMKRIDWLIDQGRLSEALRDLAHSVREDGNDGAHDGSLDEKDAADLLDFATLLLERQFAEPERLRLAKQRREDRRSPVSESRPVAAPQR